MPKLYEYFGITIFFYSNEHDPVHVHGRYQGRESKAELLIKDGQVIEIKIEEIRGKRPLEGSQLKDFKKVVEHFSEEIVGKWIDYFVYHKNITPTQLTKKFL